MNTAPAFTRTHATEWVCTDCHLAVAGYTADDTGHDMPTPFADFPDVEDVANGSDPNVCEYHDGQDEETALELHTECDHDSFSLHPCAGCGSSLAGDRYAVTVSYIEWDGVTA